VTQVAGKFKPRPFLSALAAEATVVVTAAVLVSVAMLVVAAAVTVPVLVAEAVAADAVCSHA